VLAHGWNATAYQIVNPGIAHWFAAAGDAVVGYTEWSGVAVVAGAPVCRPERLAQVAAEFERQSARAGRTVCYFGAEARLETLYRDDPGSARVLLGAQPVWDPARWPAIVSGNASLRAQLNRARNKGVAVSEWPAEKAESSQALRDILSQWLATRGLPPLHFLVEPETLSRLGDRRVFVATRAGTPVAFLVASPVPCRAGWLVEQFVRGSDAVNGTTQLMVDAAMRGVAASGAAYVTLGLAPLSRRAGHEEHNPLWLRGLLGWVRAHGRRFYNFDGLDAFKARLQPDRWDPVFAIAAAPAFSPRFLYAIAGAFSGGSPVGLVVRGLARAASTELRWLAGKPG
jgi:phosphatidylglycerol lysyltransferase